ncbi:hypothetical protein SLEP1_g16129 [Rubroshorea leprosula]|uniref:Uncharacterized protein n=1 Tax=Rubroshorea leprosula TaxID=152421 RepID=A0AAV5J1I1_9ROSI|nr:hypothetical protein SLEP1_g16129 [Rubroshorea leprosula]
MLLIESVRFCYTVILLVGLYTSKSCACQWEVYNTGHDL